MMPQKEKDDAMAKTMLASNTMTDGQIDDLANKLRDAARKHRSEILSDAAQRALGTENIGMRLFAVFRELAKKMSNLVILRWDDVDRTRTPQQVLDATGRKQHDKYTDPDVIRTMPLGKGEKGETIFFRLDMSECGGWISDDSLEKEFASRDLSPEYPDNLAAVNEADPAFADDHPNCTHWRGADGKWCCATFAAWSDVRSVGVHRSEGTWGDFWWFAGRRK